MVAGTWILIFISQLPYRRFDIYSARSLVPPARLTPTLITSVARFGLTSFRANVKWAQ